MRASAIVVGGGYAGVEAARRMSDAVDVTLVSDDNYLLFTPMLAEVAAGDLDPRHITSPIREMSPQARLALGTVTGIDTAAKRVMLSTKVGQRVQELEADAVVLALGSVSSDHGVAGVRDHAIPFKTISDALTIRNRLVALLETAAQTGEESLLSVAIVGAAYSGAEITAALADFLSRARTRFYPTAPPPRVSLIDAVDQPLAGLPRSAQEAARRSLVRSGVELTLGTPVASVDDRGVVLADDTRVAAATVVWSAGVEAHPLTRQLGLATEGRRLVVDDRLRADDGIFAAGDSAAVPDGYGGICAPTAQNALRQGRYLGRNLPALIAGKSAPPFSYRSKGQLVSLGHRHAVGVVFGVPVTGVPAWFMWRSYYLARLPTWSRKVRVAFDWTLDLIFPPDISGLPSSGLGPHV
ncbi:MAG: NAD(P)/FAD-dependent oxidoreductase [Acidimicrobiia bacterium]